MKVNRSQLAREICGVALTTVDQWRAAGCPFEEPGGRGKPMFFDTIKVFKWLMQNNNIGAGDVTELLEKERLRKLKRENDEAEKLLVSINNVLEFPERLAAQIVPILENLPLITKRNYPEITGDQIQLIKKSVAECLNAIDSIEIRVD